jgi:hypothetical protein
MSTDCTVTWMLAARHAAAAAAKQRSAAGSVPLGGPKSTAPALKAPVLAVPQLSRGTGRVLALSRYAAAPSPATTAVTTEIVVMRALRMPVLPSAWPVLP